MIRQIIFLVSIGLAIATPLNDSGFITLGTFKIANGVMSTYILSAAGNQKSYDNSHQDCYDMGGVLVNLETNAEANQIRTQLGTWGVTEKIWVGGEMDGGKWYWYNQGTGAVSECTYCTSMPWDGAPSNGQGITIGGSGLSFKWTPAAKTVGKRFICEI